MIKSSMHIKLTFLCFTYILGFFCHEMGYILAKNRKIPNIEFQPIPLVIELFVWSKTIIIVISHMLSTFLIDEIAIYSKLFEINVTMKIIFMISVIYDIYIYIYHIIFCKPINEINITILKPNVQDN